MSDTARCWGCHALVSPGTVHDHGGLEFSAIPSVETESQSLRSLLRNPDFCRGLWFGPSPNDP